MKKLNQKGKDLLVKFKQLQDLADELGIDFEMDSYDNCEAMSIKLLIERGDEVSDFEIKSENLEEYFS